ncbi:hypothetical protein LG634_02730 [Streptomyces bambusae]|uniref:hypothetical protein n=1 Tax=Streptomyces bambusae TaxID=1550616 RepID=UPI001CFE4704|nr:hypothetical protein [Streptomyces bambusae]MCB5163760.1 hypothetical protein [Streptomyces bambusae]
MDVDDLPDAEDEGELRPGPLWRHALWVVGVTVAALAFSWFLSEFRLGPPDFGIPPAAPGSPWPLLALGGVTGLAALGLLRATAARTVVYAPARVGFVLVVAGVRLALAFRPEAPVLAAGAAAVIVGAAVWSGYAVWTARRAGA